MKNIMEIDGYKAVIQYDPEIEMLRGEFLGLNGGADFYAKDLDGLRAEGAISLRVFLDACKERGIEPRKEFSGKFNVRIPPALHAAISAAAAADNNKSLNQWVTEVLGHAVPVVPPASEIPDSVATVSDLHPIHPSGSTASHRRVSGG